MARSSPGSRVALNDILTNAESLSCCTTSPQLIPVPFRAADGNAVLALSGPFAALEIHDMVALYTLSARFSGSCVTTPLLLT